MFGKGRLLVGFNPELPRPYIYECEESGWQRPEEEQAGLYLAKW